MKILLIVLSVIGLSLTIVPSILVFMQEITMSFYKQLMVGGMLLWFATAPFWIKEQEL